MVNEYDVSGRPEGLTKKQMRILLMVAEEVQAAAEAAKNGQMPDMERLDELSDFLHRYCGVERDDGY